MFNTITRDQIKEIIQLLKDKNTAISDICSKFSVSRAFLYSLKEQMIREGIVTREEVSRRNTSYKTFLKDIKEELDTNDTSSEPVDEEDQA